ncbi:MAG TPA: hypothetical protein VNT51_05280 [Miltoncostaeaceae bacterium]|nr:hypothetical protein [Miltoncostaeaceae bacterium]
MPMPIATLSTLLTGTPAPCDLDGTDAITDTTPVIGTTVAAIHEDPEPLERDTVRVTGEVGRVLPSRADRQAFVVDELLVVAPQAPDDLARRATLELTGTVHRVRADDPDLPFNSGGAGDEVLVQSEGEPALYATEFEVR